MGSGRGLGYRVACRRYVFGAGAPLSAFGFQFAGAVSCGSPVPLFQRLRVSYPEGVDSRLLVRATSCSPSFPLAVFISDVQSGTINVS